MKRTLINAIAIGVIAVGGLTITARPVSASANGCSDPWMKWCFAPGPPEDPVSHCCVPMDSCCVYDPPFGCVELMC